MQARGDIRNNHFNHLNSRFNLVQQNLSVQNLHQHPGWHEDWHDWYGNYWYHSPWVHGYWGMPPYPPPFPPGGPYFPPYGSYWDYMWSQYPVASAFGLTMWGINRLGYWFGYAPYYNPYYVAPLVVGPTVIDYSEPLVVIQPVATDSAAATPAAPPASLPKFEEARQAFYDGRYPRALELVNEALADAPRDAVMHEFRALVLFALGQYQDAAATLHAVLAVGPGWDWTTLVGLYPNVDVYTSQLRALESFVGQNPQRADARFVLAYHYITTRHNDVAANVLRQLISLQPRDEVARQLYQMLTGTPVDGEPPSPPAPATPSPELKLPPIPATALLGSWLAQGAGDARFGLTLGANNDFTWTFEKGGKQQSIQGVYAIRERTLALEPDGGGVMLAQITEPANGRFHFQMIGGAADDPGLNFQKQPSGGPAR